MAAIFLDAGAVIADSQLEEAVFSTRETASVWGTQEKRTLYSKDKNSGMKKWLYDRWTYLLHFCMPLYMRRVDMSSQKERKEIPHTGHTESLNVCKKMQIFF